MHQLHCGAESNTCASRSAGGSCRHPTAEHCPQEGTDAGRGREEWDFIRLISPLWRGRTALGAQHRASEAMEPLGRSCPCFPAAGKVLRKGRCRMKGGIQRCCRPGGAGGRRAAPQTPQAPWFAEAGGPACNRVRTSMLWIHSPAPFSWGWGTLQCRCKLMCSRETERLVFLLRPLTGQVLSTKFPAASLQGQGRLPWESQSVPLREGEVGTQAESPASTPALQRVSNPPV